MNVRLIHAAVTVSSVGLRRTPALLGYAAPSTSPLKVPQATVERVHHNRDDTDERDLSVLSWPPGSLLH